MSLLSSKRGCLFLTRLLPTKIQKRTNVREQIHKYREPDKFKKDMLVATQPYFKKRYDLPSETCKGNLQVEHDLKPLDKIFVSELVEDLQQNEFVLVFQHNYTPFQSERVYKNTLIKSGGIFRSHKNGVYREAFKILKTDDQIHQLFVSRNSVVIGKLDKLSNCVTALIKMPQFILLGGCIENEVYNHDQLVKIGRQPNIDYSRATLLSILETPSLDLVQCLEQHQDHNLIADKEETPPQMEQTIEPNSINEAATDEKPETNKSD